MRVIENITKITRSCPTRPCYEATVQVTLPPTPTAPIEAEEPYVYTAYINNNRDTTVKHETPTQKAPCL